MRISLKLSFLCGASVFALLAASGAHAQSTYSANLSVQAGSLPASNQSQSAAIPVGVGSSQNYGNYNSASGSDYGYSSNGFIPGLGQEGSGFETSSNGYGTYTSSGSFEESRTITNNSNATFDYKLTYLIGPGSLTASIPTGSFTRPGTDGTNPGDTTPVSVAGGVSAGLTATVKLNGTVEVSYASSVSIASQDATPVFQETGATLNASGPAYSSPSSFEYTWNPTKGTIDLGNFAPGQSFTIDYLATSRASGTTVGNTQTLCGQVTTTQNYGTTTTTTSTECAGGPSVVGTSLAYFDDPFSTGPGAPPSDDPFGGISVTYVSGGTGGGGTGGTGGGGTGGGGGGFAGDPLSLQGNGNTNVPEPATAALVGAGVLALASFRRRISRV